MNGTADVSPTERVERVGTAGRAAVQSMGRVVLAVHDIATNAGLGNKWDVLDGIADAHKHLATAAAWVKAMEREALALPCMRPTTQEAA